ncbi:MAG TPA: YihY/virulence factor BrkB family protein [Steroidobacteraceae bacterium]|nr:YihY/virulence factor BrkB family protein [Steroidobacteraceae bacterium]
MKALSGVWELLKDTVVSFIDDDALSRGAAISFYTVTSIAPLLLIVIAIAGLAFGREAAQNAIIGQLSGLMGDQTAQVLQAAVASASGKSSGIVATIIGVLTLMATASGVFGEMQSALNTIWKAKAEGATVTRLIRARATSLGLVAALGFLLMVSLAMSAALTAFGGQINAILPFGKLILSVFNFIVSLALISVLFAAIYKILPDRRLEWRDVIVGALATAVLFTVGKSLIGWYIGSSAVASSYGAAGALIILLLWVYYSAEIFLLGAEFTKVYANKHGSKQGDPIGRKVSVKSEQDPFSGGHRAHQSVTAPPGGRCGHRFITCFETTFLFPTLCWLTVAAPLSELENKNWQEGRD